MKVKFNLHKKIKITFTIAIDVLNINSINYVLNINSFCHEPDIDRNSKVQPTYSHRCFETNEILFTGSIVIT